MNGELVVRCRDLGVEHDGTLTGASLDDLVDCAQGLLRDEGIKPATPESAHLLKAAIRSALLQTARPRTLRSSNLKRVISSIFAPTPQARSSS